MIDYLSKFKLDGKIAVVTGGAGLIGKQISLAFAQAGAKTIILDINKKVGLELVAELRKDNFLAEFVLLDVTDIKNIKNNISKLFLDFGKIDVWVNSAYPRTADWGLHLEDVSSDSWSKNVDMNLNSYCLTTKEVAELMKKNKTSGSIINFGSIYGVVGPDFSVYKDTSLTCPAAYSAIKGGIINFSKYAASYYGKYNIRINSLCPGGVLDNQNKSFIKNYNDKVPLGRLANAEEIASATLFLASNAASYITGSTFLVDGGWTSI